MRLTFLEQVQLKRADEQVAKPFRDLPGERPGNPAFVFQVRRANLFPKQLDLLILISNGATEDNH